MIVPEDPEWEVEHEAFVARFHERRLKPVTPDFDSSEQSGLQAAWQPAPRRTEADDRGDTRSLRRALDTRLFLLLLARGRMLLCFLLHPSLFLWALWERNCLDAYF